MVKLGLLYLKIKLIGDFFLDFMKTHTQRKEKLDSGLKRIWPAKSFRIPNICLLYFLT